ncbi:MAG TPA: GNAT family N-acetyltransferase [Gaiellaceae bacterium]|nr:GNAT family N-acetyltransferase [Gaiellaceae bacterium]
MIRQATPADSQLVWELWHAFNVEVRDLPWRDPDEDDFHPDVSLLADEDGVVSLRREGSRHYVVDLLYVRPEARGKGVGEELMRAAADHVREQGADHVELIVLESNAAARALYEQLGFTTIERRLAAPVERLRSEQGDGPSFGTVHVQTDDVDKVRRDASKVLRTDPEIGVESGWVRVRSDATDEDPAKLKTLAKELSYTSAGVTVALGVERGAVVRYNLFDRGADVDEYLSVPEFYGPLPPGDVYAMGANATVVARLTGADPKRVREVVRTAATAAELPPAQELYEQIAAVMGLTP